MQRASIRAGRVTRRSDRRSLERRPPGAGAGSAPLAPRTRRWPGRDRSDPRVDLRWPALRSQRRRCAPGIRHARRCRLRGPRARAARHRQSSRRPACQTCSAQATISAARSAYGVSSVVWSSSTRRARRRSPRVSRARAVRVTASRLAGAAVTASDSGRAGGRSGDHGRRDDQGGARRRVGERTRKRVAELTLVVDRETAGIPGGEGSHEGPRIFRVQGRAQEQVEESLEGVDCEPGVDAQARDRVADEGGVKACEATAGVEALGLLRQGEGLTPDAELERTRPGHVRLHGLKGAFCQGPASGGGVGVGGEAAQRTRELEQDAGRVGRRAGMPGVAYPGDRRGRGLCGVGFEIAHGLRIFIGLPARGLKPRSDLQSHSGFRRIFAFWIDALRSA